MAKRRTKKDWSPRDPKWTEALDELLEELFRHESEAQRQIAGFLIEAGYRRELPQSLVDAQLGMFAIWIRKTLKTLDAVPEGPGEYHAIDDIIGRLQGSSEMEPALLGEFLRAEEAIDRVIFTDILAEFDIALQRTADRVREIRP